MEKVVIWDFNGTLLDDFELCLRAINQMLASRGLRTLSASDYLGAFDFPVKDYYRSLGFDFHREPFADLAAEYMALYRPASFSCLLRAGVKDMLGAIRSAGIHQALLSATRQDFLMEQVRHFNLESYFDAILGLDDIFGRSKVQMACRWFSAGGFSPEKSILIGDTVHDGQVAKALGCRCMLLTGGHNSRDRLVATGSPVADDLAELSDLILAHKK